MKTKAILVFLLAVAAFGANNDVGTTSRSTFRGFENPSLVGTGSFSGSESTMSPRFFRSGTPGDACSTFSSGNFQYIEYQFFTDNTGSLTATFDPAACGTGVFVTFHTQPFNPANICQNYVWSFGSSQLFTETFPVTPATYMTMVVSGVANAPGVTCGPFSYEIIGDGSPASVPVLGPAGLMVFVCVLGLVGVAFMIRKKKLA